MPHIILEYASNSADTLTSATFFAELHEALLELESFPLSDIKSRTRVVDDYHLADGAANRTFAHLQISLLSGRDVSVRQRIAQTGMRLLTRYFGKSLATLDCQLSVEVREMERSCYAKHRSPPAEAQTPDAPTSLRDGEH